MVNFTINIVCKEYNLKFIMPNEKKRRKLNDENEINNFENLDEIAFVHPFIVSSTSKLRPQVYTWESLHLQTNLNLPFRQSADSADFVILKERDTNNLLKAYVFVYKEEGMWEKWGIWPMAGAGLGGQDIGKRSLYSQSRHFLPRDLKIFNYALLNISTV